MLRQREIVQRLLEHHVDAVAGLGAGVEQLVLQIQHLVDRLGCRSPAFQIHVHVVVAVGQDDAAGFVRRFVVFEHGADVQDHRQAERLSRVHHIGRLRLDGPGRYRRLGRHGRIVQIDFARAAGGEAQQSRQRQAQSKCFLHGYILSHGSSAGISSARAALV